MLFPHQVPVSESALLVVDVQDSFKVGPRWARRSNPDLETNLTALVEAYRAAGRPVIYVLHSDPDPGFETTSPHYRLMDFLSPAADEPVVHKTTRNAFTSTPLLPMLLERGVRRVAVTGISTEQCCETTARVAADLGLAVDFVLDATCTFPIEGPGGDELGTDDIIQRTVFCLRNRFARITSAAELAAELAGAGETALASAA